MNDFFKLLKKHRLLFFLYLIFGALSQSLPGILFPFAQKLFIDTFLFNPNISSVILIIVLLFSYGIVTILIGTLFIRVSGKLKGLVINDLRNTIYNKLIYSKWTEINKKGHGNIISLIVNDPSAILQILDPLKELIMCIFIIIGSSIMLFFIEMKSLIAFSFISLIVIVYYLLNSVQGKKSSMSSGKYQESLGNLTNKISDDVNGLREIQFYNKFDTQKETFGKHIKNTFDCYINMYMVYSNNAVLYNGFNLFINMSIFCFVFYLFWQKSESAGSAVATIQYLIQISSLATGIGVYWIQISAGLGAFKKVKLFLDEAIDVKYDSNNKLIKKSVKNLITLKDINYNIEDKQIIKNLNLTILENDKIGITGLNGTGKTTMLNIILGLLEPDSGNMTMMGQDATHSSIFEKRHLMTPIFQEPYLFNGTIKNNICLLDSYPENEILNTIKKVGFYSFFKTLPNGLDTLVGEKGYNLSGGERQKIGMLRALMRKPKILIIDEGTSWMDSESEIKLIEYLNSQPILLVLVTHKYQSLEKLKRIIVLGENGTIVEDGSPQDLIKNNGYFYSLKKLSFI